MPSPVRSVGLEELGRATGTLRVADGGSEGIDAHRATYTVASGGNNLHQLLRCASDSYRFDLTSDVTSRGGNLTGTWSEASRGINGAVAGRASNGQFNALVTASGFRPNSRWWRAATGKSSPSIRKVLN